MNVNAQLVNVTRRIAKEGIGKTRKNAQQGYNFRGVDEVMNAFAPILADEGLFLRPRFTEREVAERINKNGNALFYVTVRGEFDFSNESGETVTVGPFYGEAMDSGDKATNKAMATAFKYAMFQTFCVPLEGVTGGDADLETHEVAPRPIQIRGNPNEGAWESMNEEEQAYLLKVAAGVAHKMSSEGPDAAHAYLESLQLDAQEKHALWTRFDSKVRSALKKAHKAATEGQKEAA